MSVGVILLFVSLCQSQYIDVEVSDGFHQLYPSGMCIAFSATTSQRVTALNSPTAYVK